MKRFFLRAFIGCLTFMVVSAELSFSEIPQNNSAISIDSLHALGNLIQRGANDSIRISANRIFQNKLRNLLQQNSMLNLDSIKTVSMIKSPDHTFNLVTWQLPSYDGSYSYYGFIQLPGKKTSMPKVIDLTDSTYSIASPDMAKLSSTKWFGAVYYKMIPVKKDGKSFYTLLGWKGNNPVTTQKVIDVLYFSGDKVLFGYPFFKTGSVYKSRLVFEYISQAVMSLRYDESKKIIVFDHLSSGNKNQNSSSANGPDGTYDALKFKNGRWELSEDVDINADFIPKSTHEKLLKDSELKRK